MADRIADGVFLRRQTIQLWLEMDQIQPEAAVTGPSAEIVIRFSIVFDPRKAARQAFSQLNFSPGHLQLIIFLTRKPFLHNTHLSNNFFIT